MYESNWVAAYETGENDIPTWVLLKLSEYYITSIDYILFNTDERVKYKNSKIDKKDLVMKCTPQGRHSKKV